MLNLFQHLINQIPNQVQDDKYDILFCATIIATNMLKIEDLKQLPNMIKPIALDELKKFFRMKAVELGLKKVEK